MQQRKRILLPVQSIASKLLKTHIDLKSYVVRILLIHVQFFDVNFAIAYFSSIYPMHPPRFASLTNSILIQLSPTPKEPLLILAAI